MGMPQDEYWNGDSTLVKYYRKADEIRKEERNTELWLQGLYVYEAILDLAPILRAFTKNPKPEKYSKEPYPISEKERKRRKERDERIAAEEFRAKMIAKAEAINRRLKEEQENVRHSD